MTLYVCTYAQKGVTEDSYEEGLLDNYRLVMAHSLALPAKTVAALLKRIESYYDLSRDDLVPPEEGPVTRIVYSRMEDEDGDLPSERAWERWKASQQRLWMADYEFSVERREVSPIALEEFAVKEPS